MKKKGIFGDRESLVDILLKRDNTKGTLAEDGITEEYLENNIEDITTLERMRLLSRFVGVHISIRLICYAILLVNSVMLLILMYLVVIKGEIYTKLLPAICIALPFYSATIYILKNFNFKDKIDAIMFNDYAVSLAKVEKKVLRSKDKTKGVFSDKYYVVIGGHEVPCFESYDYDACYEGGYVIFMTLYHLYTKKGKCSFVISLPDKSYVKYVRRGKKASK